MVSQEVACNATQRNAMQCSREMYDRVMSPMSIAGIDQVGQDEMVIDQLSSVRRAGGWDGRWW